MVSRRSEDDPLKRACSEEPTWTSCRPLCNAGLLEMMEKEAHIGNKRQHERNKTACGPQEGGLGRFATLIAGSFAASFSEAAAKQISRMT